MIDKTKEGFIHKQSLEYEMAESATKHDGLMGITLVVACLIMIVMGVTRGDLLGLTLIVISLAYSTMGYKFLQRYYQRKRTCHGLQRSL